MKNVFNRLVTLLGVAAAVFAAAGGPGADPRDALGGRPSLPGDVGLWGGYTGNNGWDFNSQVPVGEVRFQGVYPAYVSDGTHWTGVKADGTTGECYWGGNQTYYYEGYMYFRAATYTFISAVDDWAQLEIDGQPLLTPTSYEESAKQPKATWTAPRAGWYPVRFRTGNGSGGYGPINSGVGLGWNTTGYTTYDDSENWQKFIDPGDGSLLRTTAVEPLDVVRGLLHENAAGGGTLYLDVKAVTDLVGGDVYIAYTTTDPTGYDGDSLAWTAKGGLVAATMTVSVAVPDTATYAVVSVVKEGKRYWTEYVALDEVRRVAENLPVAFLDSVSVSAGALAANLTAADFGGEDSATVTFKVTCPASGRVVETVRAVAAAGSASYAIDGLVPDRTLTVSASIANANGSTEVAATFDVKVSWDEWNAAGAALPAGLPFFARNTLVDPKEGDTVSVEASLTQAGAGETASVTFEYGLQADLSDKRTVAFGDYAAGASIRGDASVLPGNTYYYRLIATGTDGETDVTDIASFTTPAGAAFAGGLSSSFDKNVVTYTLALAELGAGESVELQIYSGLAEDALVAGERKTVTSTDPVTFSVEYPTLNGNVYAKVVASNDCATAFWTAETPVQATELVDYTEYTWKAGVTEGAWNDPANWTPNNDNPYTTYPNSGKAHANFKNCTVPTTVYVSGSVRVDVIKDVDHTSLDLTFRKDPAAETATINVWATWWDGFGDSVITIDGVEYLCHDGKYMEFKKLLVTNGATYQSSQEVQHHKGGAVIEVSNKSKWIQADWTLSMNGEDTVFILDDSTYKCDKGNGLIYLARNKNGGGDTIIVRGKHPVFDCGNGISVCSDYQIGNTPLEEMKHTKVIFEIPEGGYEEPPFKRGTFLSGGHLMTDVLVDPDSPVFRGGKTITKLVDTTGGINRDWISHEGQVRPARFDLTYAGGTEEAPNELWFSYLPKGLRVTIR